MAMTLIATNPDSTDVASVTFNSGIDSTYKLYIFKFININPATDGAEFQFQVNATDGADYNDSNITSTFHRSYHYEDDSGAAWGYQTSHDIANAASYQVIAYDTGNGADESASGELYLFNPSNTTYVKHFYSRFSVYGNTDLGYGHYAAGYINDTTAIDDINFKMSSGNMDGTIKMYGVG